jgi:hypothetical protein
MSIAVVPNMITLAPRETDNDNNNWLVLWSNVWASLIEISNLVSSRKIAKLQ